MKKRSDLLYKDNQLIQAIQSYMKALCAFDFGEGVPPETRETMQ